MKPGWEISRLGDLFDITSSKRVFESDWTAAGVPFYRAREIVKLSQDGFVKNELFISDDMYSRYSAKYGIPKEGDIMVTGVGTLGICYVVRKNDKFYFKDGNIIWLKKKSKVNSRFVEYAFKSEFLREQIDDSVGATVGTYTINKAKNTRIPVPSLVEQQRIVGILDEAFAAITTARANAERNIQNAHSLFELQRDSVFARHPGCGERRFGEFATFRNGINFTRSSRGEAVKMVGVKDFKNSFWLSLDELDTVVCDGRVTDSGTLEENDLLFVRSNGNIELIGRCLLVGPIAERITHSGFTIKARLNDRGVSPRYLCHFLKAKKTRRQMIEGGIGTNIKSLNQGTLSNLVVPVPSLAEQSQIVEEVEALEVETQRLASIYERKVCALEELKQSLLHSVFTGQL